MATPTPAHEDQDDVAKDADKHCHICNGNGWHCEAATIERCAQIAEQYIDGENDVPEAIAVAIRNQLTKLRDEP